jgi:hypothetical protein
LGLSIARDQMVSKCADRLIDASCKFNESIQLRCLHVWVQQEIESLRALAVRLSSSVQACQFFLDAHQKVGPRLDRAVKQLAVERDCQRDLELAQTRSKFADRDTKFAAAVQEEKTCSSALAAAHQQLCSLKQQLHALTLIAPEVLGADPLFSQLGLGADSPLALLTVDDRSFSDDYKRRHKREPLLGTIWRAVEKATGQAVVLKEYSENQLHLLDHEVSVVVLHLCGSIALFGWSFCCSPCNVDQTVFAECA